MEMARWVLVLTSFVFLNTLNAQNNWSIDKELKFQIGYFPNKKLLELTGPNVKKVSTAKFAPLYMPDICNINLKDFLTLGFQIPSPKNPSQYNFYLKLYSFPKNFIAKDTTFPIISEYLLDKADKQGTIKDYLSEGKNLYVKLGYIAKSNTNFSVYKPYPSFKVIEEKSFQNIFNKHLPFYSLYLNPTAKLISKDEKSNASNSTIGVQAFYKSLYRAYKNNLNEVKGKDKSIFYFMVESKRNNEITILSLPKKVTIFDNWQELPMPQNPEKVFLSSLLLVKLTNYKLKKSIKDIKALTIESDSFNNEIEHKVTKILEIGSVVHL